MLGIPRRIRGIAIGYGLTVAVLLPAAVFWSEGARVCWYLLAALSILVIAVAPWLRGSPCTRLWGRTAQLSTVGVVAIALHHMLGIHSRPPDSVGTALLDAAPYLCAVAIALMLLPGRSGRGAWFGDLDPLMLFLTLFVLIATLVVLLVSAPHHPSFTGTAVLCTYGAFDVVVIVILGVHLRRDRRRLGVQGRLVLVGVMLLMVGAIGVYAVDVRDYELPRRLLHAVWLAGLVLIAAAALIQGEVAATLERVPRRIGIPNGAVIAVLVFGPPLEMINPGFTNLITLLLLAVLCLLLSQAEHRIQNERTIRAATVAQAAEQYFRTLVANASDMILTIDQDGRFGYASPSATALTAGHDPESADLERILGPDNAQDVRKLLRTTRGHGSVTSPLHWRLTVGETTVEADVRIADLRADPRVGALVVTMRDVTAPARLHRQLRRLAFYDNLTGLGTRAGFVQRYAESAAPPGAAPLVFAVDIDGFTELNQLHGRAAGDGVLVAVAARLARVQGYAARLSGGRFALLIGRDSPADGQDWDVEAQARMLQEAVSGPVDLEAARITVSVNVGAADTAGVRDADEALEQAGLAEAEARRDRHRRWRAYRPAMLEAVRERDGLRRDLAAAIAQDELCVHYQPFVELSTGRVVGFEALARWHHRERGLLAPDDFIPLAEDTGLIGPLGNWILRRAVRDTAALRCLPGGDQLYIAVNISAQQLADPRFADEVATTLETAGLPPGALGLEVVESSVLDRAGDIAVLRALRATGIVLAIDDFGTGNSALSYLIDLPFETLKIDRSFVTGISGDPRRVGLVRAIVGIAESLGLTVVAEGIETEADRAVLAAAGCRFGQGYLFSPPVPLAQAQALVERTWPVEC